MIRVKICGVTDPVGFDAGVEAGADWIGLVFFPPSPRHVTPAQAAALSARVAGGPPRVGLFVEPGDDDVRTVLDTVRLDVLQLHVAPARAAELRARFGLPVWRAVGVGGTDDLPRDAGGIDGFVLDAQPPKGATRPGGNALAFDWTLLRGWQAPAPWLLAGGLNPGNVAAAIAATGATAVDVSSGVERMKGIKDPDLIRAFVAAAKAVAADDRKSGDA